jgi:hypothetical protein
MLDIPGHIVKFRDDALGVLGFRSSSWSVARVENSTVASAIHPETPFHLRLARRLAAVDLALGRLNVAPRLGGGSGRDGRPPRDGPRTRLFAVD